MGIIKRNRISLVWSIAILVLLIGMMGIGIVSADSLFDIFINDSQIAFTEDLGIPEIVNSRTMVPLRIVLENMGYELVWDAENKKVTIFDAKTKVEFTLGESFAFVNGVRTPMDVQDGKEIDTKAYINNGRTMVPLRFITEAFGANIGYEKINGRHVIKISTVEITPPEIQPVIPPVVTPPPNVVPNNNNNSNPKSNRFEA